MSLNGKVALVTGGAQGIGRAVVQSLLQSSAKVSLPLHLRNFMASCPCSTLALVLHPSCSFTLIVLTPSDWNCLQTDSGCLGSAHGIAPSPRAQDTCCRYSDIKQSDGVSETFSAEMIVMNYCENKELISIAYLTN